MYNTDTEVLFPLRVIPSLQGMNGETWKRLVEHVNAPDALPAERHAFVLMMVRACGCVGCNADSFRAMRGCSQCARLTVRRFRSSEQELMEQYQQVLKEVEAFQKKAGLGS